MIMKILKQMKNKFYIAILIILFTGIFACTYGFPKGFDKDEYTKEAEKIIEVVNTRDYAAVYGMLRTDMQENISPDDLKNAWDGNLEKLGAFEKFGNPVLSGEADTEKGEEFAMIVYYCYYENGKAIYTIYLDDEMEMTSISMKLD